MLLRLLLPIGLLSLVPVASAKDRVDYLRDIKPVLRARCYACHGALKQRARLRLDTAAFIRKGGRHGPAAEPGKPEKSLLVERISAKDEEERMPPEGAPLTPEEIGRIRQWVAEGANVPENEEPEEDPQQHWAFQKPVKAPLPTFDSGGNAIDAFLSESHRRHNLQPVAPIQKSLLLRRAYLDLIGLPPTLEELRAFMADKRADAFERAVDQLLASPQYGERWGRHWMDIWRYTDWYGLGKQLRYSQKHIWHWRDWILESLNSDKGYDQMVREMLAADEMMPLDRKALRATGYLARSYFLFNRTTWLDATIEHTSKAFMGLTLQCAKCHDHKYDPIRQLDYYRFRAIFEPHQVRLDPVQGEVDLEKDGLPRVFDAHPEAPTYLHIRGNEKDPDKDRGIEPGIPEILSSLEMKPQPVALPPTAHNPDLHAFVLEDRLAIAHQDLQLAKTALGKAQRDLQIFLKKEPVKKPEKGKPFLVDDFSSSKEWWQKGPGKWSYQNGKLSQAQVGARRAYFRTVDDHPTSFQAIVRFTTLGGEKWKSVGLAFDVQGSSEIMVYLSAVRPGSKLQVSYKVNGKQAYPPEAAQPRSVQTKVPYEMIITVRDRLVNVAIDGAHALAYSLPVARQPGKMDLVAFDAEVAFDSLEVRELPAHIEMASPGSKGQKKPQSVESAKHAIAVAEKAIQIATLRAEALQAIYAAEMATAQKLPKAKLSKLRQKAARAEAQWQATQAEKAVLVAERNLAIAPAKGKAKAKKDLTAARSRLAQAQKRLANPGEKYNRIQSSLKALEGPAETEASRKAPYPVRSTGRRKALAQWLTDRRNPLTARVAINHIWLRHFGQALVDPVTDFGRRTKPPVQQKLLDWLAVELMDHDWSMKHLHRLIVTSQAYRRGSSTLDADPETMKADPKNQYYWRRKPLRMEAQVVRDSLLHAAGQLRHQTGGPTIDPKKTDTAFRRSLYFTQSRDDVHPFLTMFDDANIRACYRRSESIVPQQSLALLNSRLSLAMAQELGRLAPKEEKDAGFVRRLFLLILSREPWEREQQECLAMLEEMTRLLKTQGRPEPWLQARQNLAHVLFNHNDFITIR